MASITFTETTAAEDAATITALLVAHNDLHTAKSRRLPFQIVARDDAGQVQGGALGYTIHRWCYVDILVLAEPLRGNGNGAKLLDEIERLARARDCIGVHLTSYSFQAPVFYERHGYTAFGRIDDLPPGHHNTWLMKRF